MASEDGASKISVETLSRVFDTVADSVLQWEICGGEEQLEGDISR